MNKKFYIIIIILSIILIITTLILASVLETPWNTVSATISGGIFSFLASIIIQQLASSEQNEMIKSITIGTDGISVLPDSFLRLKWLSYVTKEVSKKSESPPKKEYKFELVSLRKIGGSGPRLVVYRFSITNPIGNLVDYTITFIGSQNSVVAVITRENETTSSITFDVIVPDAGSWFGVSYLTDWAGERILTIAVVSTSELSKKELGPEIKNAFLHWKDKIDLNISDTINALLDGKVIDNLELQKKPSL